MFKSVIGWVSLGTVLLVSLGTVLCDNLAIQVVRENRPYLTPNRPYLTPTHATRSRVHQRYHFLDIIFPDQLRTFRTVYILIGHDHFSRGGICDALFCHQLKE